MKEKLGKAIRTVLFFALAGLLLMGSGEISIPSYAVRKQKVLYEEQAENSIDIAFVGSSTSYRYYDIMGIWGQYGLTSCIYFAPDLPFDMTVSVLDYVQNNQSPQLYVIDLRSVLNDEFNMRYFGEHEVVTYKEAAASALDLFRNPLNRFTTAAQTGYFEGEEYLQTFKILYNHEGFLEGLNPLVTTPLAYQGNQMMMFRAQDMTYRQVDFSAEPESPYTLTQQTRERLNDLFSYCRQNELNVYFTFTPYVGAQNAQDENIRREIGAFVSENGFPFTDFRAQFEEIGLDTRVNFYDEDHVNVLGAQKYTQFALPIFLEAYEIEPQHEEAVVEEWDEQYQVWRYVFEREMEELRESSYLFD